MKKIRTILNLILLGIVMLILTNENVSKCIDDVVLLENRNPGYYNNLSRSSKYYISNNAVDEVNENLLTNVMQSTDFVKDGFKILVHEDGSFTFSGTYNGVQPTFIYPIEIGRLKSGDYILSDGRASIKNGIEVRMFGCNTLSNGEREFGNCTRLPGDGVIHWDENEFEEAVFDVVIYPGFSAENLCFYPMLRAASSGELPYQNAFRKLKNVPEDQSRDDYVTYLQIKIQKNELKKITKNDWRIFCNEIKYRKNVDWVCFDFGDGTGIQMKDLNFQDVTIGEIDNIGRVIQVRGNVEEFVPSWALLTSK